MTSRQREHCTYLDTPQNQKGDFLQNSEMVLMTVCQSFQIITPAQHMTLAIPNRIK